MLELLKDYTWKNIKEEIKLHVRFWVYGRQNKKEMARYIVFIV